MKNTLFKIKIFVDITINQILQKKEHVFEHKTTKTSKKERYSDLWGNIKLSNICAIGVPKGEREETSKNLKI